MCPPPPPWFLEPKKSLVWTPAASQLNLVTRSISSIPRATSHDRPGHHRRTHFVGRKMAPGRCRTRRKRLVCLAGLAASVWCTQRASSGLRRSLDNCKSHNKWINAMEDSSSSSFESPDSTGQMSGRQTDRHRRVSSPGDGKGGDGGCRE